MFDNDLATSEGGEAFTPEEQAAFEAYERGDEGPSAAPAAVEVPEGAPAGGEAPAPAAAAPEAAPGEVVDPEADAGSPDENKGKFVRHGAFHQERERRKAVEKELADFREKAARVDERLRILTEAARQPQAPAPAAPAAEPPKVPNPEEDIFGYAKHLEQQIADLKSGLERTAQETREEREFKAVRDDYIADLNRFGAQEPAFADAFRFIAQTRAAELKALGATDAQIPQMLGKEELDVAIAARQRGVSPAELLFQVAKARGFAPKAPEPAPAPAAAPAETAAQRAERVAAGQAGPGKSLSVAGGAPAGEVTFEMLASMNERDFEAFATKNPEKLARLMGAEG